MIAASFNLSQALLRVLRGLELWDSVLRLIGTSGLGTSGFGTSGLWYFWLWYLGLWYFGSSVLRALVLRDLVFQVFNTSPRWSYGFWYFGSIVPAWPHWYFRVWYFESPYFKFLAFRFVVTSGVGISCLNVFRDLISQCQQDSCELMRLYYHPIFIYR